jgi:hypothetical protein
MVLRECYINDWHTTTCSGMQGHHIYVTRCRIYQVGYNFQDIVFRKGPDKKKSIDTMQTGDNTCTRGKSQQE